jgi:hypothetical protein
MGGGLSHACPGWFHCRARLTVDPSCVAQTIGNWVAQADGDECKRADLR